MIEEDRGGTLGGFLGPGVWGCTGCLGPAVAASLKRYEQRRQEGPQLGLSRIGRAAGQRCLADDETDATPASKERKADKAQ